MIQEELIKEGEDEIRKIWRRGHVPRWAEDVLTGILGIFRRSVVNARKATLDEVREKVNKEEICQQCADRIDWGIELLLTAPQEGKDKESET